MRHDVAPPAELKEQVKRSLTDKGLLAGPVRRRPVLRQLAWAAVAALFFTTGMLVGGRRSAAQPDTRAQYLLLLYEDSTFAEGDEAALVAEYGAWAGSLAERGHLVLGEKLANGLELLGGSGAGLTETEGRAGRVTGMFIIRASNDDEARALALTCPHLRYGGRIALRPIDRT